VRVLSGAGHQVRWAGTGAEALTAARDDVPDVVLLDIQLPDADGLEIAGALRRDPATETVRLIGMSATAPATEDRQRFDGFLLKPVPFPALLEAVDI
jgi:CheY-like chemotaxis protein